MRIAKRNKVSYISACLPFLIIKQIIIHEIIHGQLHGHLRSKNILPAALRALGSAACLSKNARTLGSAAFLLWQAPPIVVERLAKNVLVCKI